MALHDLPPGVLLTYPGTHTDLISDAALNLSAAAHRVAFVFQCPKAGNLDSFDFMTGTVTQATNGVRTSFRAVDLATGFPVAGNLSTKTTAVIASNTWYTPGSFDVPVTVARGDYISAVIQILTFVAGDNIDIRYGTGTIGFQRFPFMARNDGAVWTASRGTANMAIRYTDGTFAAIPGCVALKSQATTIAINNGSSPNELGDLFTLKSPMMCAGAYFFWAASSGNGAYRLRLYGPNGEFIVGAPDNNGLGESALLYRPVVWPAVRLRAGVNYRLAMRPITPTNVATRRFQFQSSALRAVSPWGSAWQRTERNLNGPWTETPTEIIPMGLLQQGLWGADT